MRNLLNPKWLFIVNTLPVLLLFFMAYGEYSIVKTLLKPENQQLWSVYAISLGSLGVLTFFSSLWMTIRKKQLPLLYVAVTFLAYTVYLYIYMWNANDLIPWDVPRWISSGNILLYGGTFLMPTLAFCVLVAVIKLTPDSSKASPLFNFLGAVAVPVIFFVFFHLSSGLWRIFDYDIDRHLIIIFIIGGTAFFLFFIARVIYIIASRRGAVANRFRLFWKVPVTLVLPIVGLLVNSGGIFMADSGVFGDFSHPWYYALSAINALLLCITEPQNPKPRLALLFGRSITFSFTFYFFIVFLPFLPLSVIAIIALGLGFLMLVPLVLFIVHIRDIVADNMALTGIYTPLQRSAVMIAGFLILPICITLSYLADRHTLNDALAYVYAPDYSKSYDIDEKGLQHTLNVVKMHKNSWGRSILETHTPYLSSYYNWLVLDNMVLSDAKAKTLEMIFLGKSDIYVWERRDEEERKVKLTSLKHNSIFDETRQQWISTIDLELTNNTPNGLAEYATSLNLPDGCWINDYYLYVGNKKEKGILAEKKAATWVYSQIRDQNRDPGILYYTGGNSVMFKVFPFTSGEVRRTGISFIHRDAVVLDFDGQKVSLGHAGNKMPLHKGKDVVYISAGEKQQLQKKLRKPYYHFIIDASFNKAGSISSYSASVNKLLVAAGPGTMAPPKFSFANTYMAHSGKNWQQDFKKQEFRGGFFAEMAIKKVLVDSYNNPSDNVPVIVLVTDSIHNAIIQKDFRDLKFTFPDTDEFIVLDNSGAPKIHSLVSQPLEVKDSAAVVKVDEVLAWAPSGKARRFLRNDSLPEIALASAKYSADDQSMVKNTWNSGLAMQGEILSQQLHPETSGSQWLSSVRHSFASGIMSPFTSYLVVENEAQKAVLKKKQDLVLSGNKSLDLGEEQRMSEPGFWYMLLLLLAVLVIKKWLPGTVSALRKK
jgi:hypothetical protein